MKRYASAAAVSLLLGGAVQAAAIDLDTGSAAAAPHGMAAPPASMSELPEPEVFAMMLVGLVLIGYRASRHSSEKFK